MRFYVVIKGQKDNFWLVTAAYAGALTVIDCLTLRTPYEPRGNLSDTEGPEELWQL